MIDTDKKIRKGLSPKRKAECFQVLRDIVIPAGTMLRHAGDDIFSAGVGTGLDGKSEFVIEVKPGAAALGVFKRVISA